MCVCGFVFVCLLFFSLFYSDFTECSSFCYETGKDITGTDIESQNQKADAAADDVLPVQIECRLNKLSTLTVHSLTPVLFPLSSCIHLFIPNIKVLTI
jgi:hypothetical protein